MAERYPLEDYEEYNPDQAVHPDAQAMTSAKTAQLEALWERLEALEHGPEERQQNQDREMGY